MAVVRNDVVQIGFDIESDELRDLVRMLDDLKKNLSGDLGDDAFDEMVRDARDASDALEGVKEAAKGIKPDGVDDVAEGLDDVKDKGNGANDKLKQLGKHTFDKTTSGLKKLASGLGKVAVAGAKALGAGIAAGAGGVAAVVGSSVKSYADYEQLKGGVETIFGTKGMGIKDYAKSVGKSVSDVEEEFYRLNAAQNTVLNNADKAYKTAGLSANDYMDTVTSFSASLIQSLGRDTATAALVADRAIVDMADNANKMGTDISMIQNAYQGFAKQNYTMLDNLKLGYGGTKEEMERLILDASKMTDVQEKLGITVDASSGSFGNIVNAISVVQASMGIAGATADEAEGTISGSLGMLKASWANTMTALIRGGDNFDKCVENLISSAKIFGNNIMPAITTALGGVGQLIEELAPEIEKNLPTIIEELLPPLLMAATSLVNSLIKALPGILSAIAKELPGILRSVFSTIGETFGIEMPFLDSLISFFSQHGKAILKVVPAVLGLVYVGSLMSKLGGLFGKGGGASGGGGGGMFKTFQSLAKMKPTTVLLGMANLGIILGGLTILSAGIASVAPFIAQLSDIGSLAEVVGTIAVLGIVGTALAKMSGTVGKIPVATVSKGLANMAIMLGGLGVLAAAFAFVSPFIAQLSYFKSILKVAAIMGVLGVLGTALTVFAGIAGLIPIPVVLAGLANIALVLGGFTALVSAYAGLAQIPGFSEFISEGGALLAKLMGILGEMAGSLVGGVAEGITNALPGIGENIAKFAENIKPMFTLFQGVDMNGVGSFFSALGGFMLKMAGNDIASIFTGGTDWGQLGTDLSTFGTNVKGFFTTVATIPPAGFTNAGLLFKALADIKNVPNTGGFAQLFSGTNDFSALADGLKQLGSQDVVNFFNTVASINTAGFDNAKLFFQALSDISKVPNTGGVAQWFSGTNDFTGLADGLNALAKTKPFFDAVSQMDFTNVPSFWKAVKEAGNIAKLDLSGLADKGTAMSNFMTKVKSFFSGAAGVQEQIASVNAAASALKRFFTTISGIVSTDLGSVNTGLSTTISKANDGVKAFNKFGSEMKKAVNIGKDALMTLESAAATAINGMHNAIASGLATIVATLLAFADSIKGVFDGIDFSSSGRNMIQGLINGILAMKQAAILAAREVANGINAEYSRIQKIHSPSRVWEDYGTYQIQGNINGLEDGASDLRKAVRNVGQIAMPYGRGYTPESTTTSNSSSYETNNYSPQFTLNMNGTVDRTTERTVKSWIMEALQEMFDSMGRTSPRTTEV